MCVCVCACVFVCMRASTSVCMNKFFCVFCVCVWRDVFPVCSVCGSLFVIVCVAQVFVCKCVYICVFRWFLRGHLCVFVK